VPSLALVDPSQVMDNGSESWALAVARPGPAARVRPPSV